MICTHYEGTKRCTREATHHIYCNGKPVPGARLCSEHATQCIEEYKAKLPDKWEARPIDEYGRLK